MKVDKIYTCGDCPYMYKADTCNHPDNTGWCLSNTYVFDTVHELCPLKKESIKLELENTNEQD